MISICVPTSDMKDGEKFFTRCLDSLWKQSYQDFEVIVTDNSDDDVIEKICEYYKTGIKYYRNPIKGMAQNTNEGIRRATGKLIKFLYMDDYLAHTDSISKIINHFKGHWLVTACLHDDGLEVYKPHLAKYSQDIHLGNNTIGGPSVLTILNENPLFFDEEMTWLLDCDYFKRCYDKWGEPDIMRDYNVVMGLHSGQATNTMGRERKLLEYNYIKQKYA